MKFKDDNSSILTENFKDHFVVVLDLTSIPDTSVNSHYLIIVGEPFGLELNFTFNLEHVNELTVLGKRMPSVANDKSGVSGKNVWNG